jgi:zinc protease
VPPLEAASAPGRLPLIRYQLANGLRVVLDVDPSEHGVVTCMTYPLGSRHEPEGKEGAAWLLQRLLSSGTPGSTRALQLARLEAGGGSSQAKVSPDYTQYLTVAPSSLLALALELEADRLRLPPVPIASFAELRRVAAVAHEQEHAAGLDGLGEQRLRQLVFQGYWPYAHAVAGTSAGLGSLTFSTLVHLQQTRMRPDAAALVIAGNFSEQDARRWIDESLSGSVSKGNAADLAVPALPRQTSERFNARVDARTKTPVVFYAWPGPGAHTSSHEALRLLAELLNQPNSSRLQAELARGGHALEASAWMLPQDGPGAFALRLRIDPRSSVDKARAVLEQELDRLRSAGPSIAELESAKLSLVSALEQELGRAVSRAPLLARHELARGDARLALTEPSRHAAVTRTQVQRAAAQYLIETRRTSVEMYPPGWPQDLPPTIVRKQHVVKAGENLIQIAKRYRSSVEAIAGANRIRSNRFIFPGQELIIPIKAKDAQRSKGRTYTVKPGDSLSVIAKRHGVSTRELAEANGRRRDQRIVIGETLTVPAALPKPKAASGQKSQLRQHRVARGDTVIGLAKRYGVSAQSLAAANGRGPKSAIFAGEVLIIPTPAPEKKSP